MNYIQEKQKPHYVSNPFSLVLGATQRLLNTNQAWAIILIVLGVLGSVSQYGRLSEPAQSRITSPANPHLDATSVIATVIFIGVVVLILVGFMAVMAVFVQGILTYIALESEKGNKASLKDAFNETYKRFWRLFGAQLLAFIKIFGWSLLFIIPGIFAALRYALLPYIVMDEPAEDTSIKAAHARSRAIVKTRLIEVFGVSVMGAVPIFGSIFDLTGKAAQYRQLALYHDKNLEKPKIHWLNYLFTVLVFVILALLILGVLLLGFYANRN